MTWGEIFFLKGISPEAEARERDANSIALKQKLGRARADPAAVFRVNEMTPEAVAVRTSRLVSKDKPAGPPQSWFAFSLPGVRLNQQMLRVANGWVLKDAYGC